VGMQSRRAASSNITIKHMFEQSYSNPDLYVQLFIDDLMLFVPQDDVASLEIVSDVQVEDTGMGAVGWFGQHGHGQNVPVFCVDTHLDLLADIPNQREYFALLKSTDEEELPLGILCNEVENLNIRRTNIYMQNLPPIMHTPHSPISELLIFEETIACIATGEDLRDYLTFLAETYEQQMLEQA